MDDKITILDLSELISQKLSSKSQEYISSNLLPNFYLYKNKILDECSLSRGLVANNVIGVVNDFELKLFAIKDSLSKRIKGTKKRIEYLSSSNLENSEIMDLMKQRKTRLLELYSDYKKIFEYLHLLIEIRYHDQIQSLFKTNPKILTKRYYWSKYNDYSGYIFEIQNDESIIMVNEYTMGGD